MNTSVLSAVFRRNFVAYFSSPTGYVFIGVFMLLTSLATYWPPEFFNSNLANLDQLNLWFPLIMLLFAPAITMGIWADERRQGTDELLLTIPANDFDVVAGKYLAAVSIYSVALALSCATNFWMLKSMGDPDLGLFFANYVGYWFVGLAMLGCGMVGSFLTSNLTVAFILGALVNVPFVAGAYAEQIVSDPQAIADVKRWSIAGRFEDFGRGVISLSSVAYFVAIAAIMFYLSMVLIGRRHWLGGRDGSAMIGHYISRAVAIGVAAIAIVFMLTNYDLRGDMTSARLNELSPKTRELLANLHEEEKKEVDRQRDELKKDLAAKKKEADAASEPAKKEAAKKEVEKIEQRLRRLDLEEARLDQPVLIDAYITRNVPEMFAAKRIDLLSKLREMQSLAKGKLKVTIYDIDPASNAAKQAKDRFGIEPRSVNTTTRGQYITDDIFLGASIRSGLNEIVIPFFELGIPVEYELIQAIVTVSETNRKTLGVVKTDADLFGGSFDMTSGMSQQKPIIRELKKHYNVVDVNPSEKIVDPADSNKQKYDVLLVVQPSSLGFEELNNLVEAVRSGVPTAIFEDPFPVWMTGVPGTDQPKQPRNMMMGMPQRPEEKGDIRGLWDALGLRLAADRFSDDDEDASALAALQRGGSGDMESVIVWQRYNPYPKLRFNKGLTSQWVFVNEQAPGVKEPFADDEITDGLFELLFPFPGALIPDRTRVKVEGDENLKDDPKPTFTPLVRTGTSTGVIRYSDVSTHLRNGTVFLMRDDEKAKGDRYILAARIRGTFPRPAPRAGQKEAPAAAQVHAVVVSDIDMLDENFFNLRARPSPGEDFKFQNVPFVLNIIDSLAEETDFLKIRNSRQQYGHLTEVEKRISEEVTQEIDKQVDAAEEKFRAAKEEEEKKGDALIKAANDKLAAQRKEGKLNAAAIKALEDGVNIQQDLARKRRDLQIIQAALEVQQQRDDALDRSKRETYALNDEYKRRALLLPLIVPLILGVIVYGYRKSREHEGASKSRMR